jgi:fructosamine-3-kinase
MPDSIRLIEAPLIGALEKAVSQYAKRDWRVETAEDLSDYACHPCAILSDGSFPVFTKLGEEDDAAEQFERELADLEYLSSNTGVAIPKSIGLVSAGGGMLFIAEAIKPVERRAFQWRQIGKTLARIHSLTSESHGFPTDGFIGPLRQDNTPAPDWVTFYRERRLVPRLAAAVDSGNLPPPVARRVEQVIKRLPELGGAEATPCLLHGDAQQNNFISTEEGTFVIDPAVYYGNPEIDLARVDCFQTVPDDVFDAYREERPIDPGFAERRSLWRVSIYLAAVAIEGQIHLDRLTGALREYE